MSKDISTCPYCEIEIALNESKMHVWNEHYDDYDEFISGFEDWKNTTFEKYSSTETPETGIEAQAVETSAVPVGEAMTIASVADAEIRTVDSRNNSLKSRTETAFKQLKVASEKVTGQVKPVFRKVYTQIRTTSEKVVSQVKQVSMNVYTQVRTTSKKVFNQVKSASMKAYDQGRATLVKAVVQTKVFYLKTKTKS
ncbi:MAG: hypothetical protein M8353_05010 [ANME-2 cluster archaeon]|nr:hypothetical protein [ANME-2 cluster archaeon]